MIAALLLAATAPGAVVVTTDGPVRGEPLPGGGGVFRGIRFAQPPVGPRRWQPPAPPSPHEEAVDATAAHPACAQPVYGDWNRAASAGGSEDCLFLDIRSPGLDPAARRPVLVWIHGGGNRGGAGGGTVESHLTDGGIVLVSIQYRLGALGFLSHPALSAEQGGTSGNYGLMDQQAALRWVRDNIAAFGGDPAHVTIAGGSAGAQDVGLHLLAPASRGLFARAIEQSGTPGFGVAPRTLAQNERLGTTIAATAGAPVAANAAALRALPLARILAAQEAVDVPDLDDDSFIWLQAVVDGRFLRETPAAALAGGRVARVPTIIGVNAQEFTGYAGQDPRPVIAREFPRTAARVRAVYRMTGPTPPAPDPRLGDVAMQLGTDLVFRCPTIAVSKALAAAGSAVWQYQLDHARPGLPVTHGSELGFVFDRPVAGDPPLRRYWLNFIRTGDPNGTEVPRWPRYDAAGRSYLAFEQDRAVARRDLRGAVCAGRAAP